MKTYVKGTIQYSIIDIQRQAFTNETIRIVIQPEFYDESGKLIVIFDKQVVVPGGCIRLDNVQVQVEIRLV